MSAWTRWSLGLMVGLLACRTQGLETVMAATVDESDVLAQIAATGSFRRGLPAAVKPVSDGVLFLRSEPRDPARVLYWFDLATGEEERLLTAAQLLDGQEETLTEEEHARRERLRLSATGITNFQLSPDERTVLVEVSGRLFVFDRVDRQVRELVSEGGPAIVPSLAPSGDKIAVIRGRDVSVVDVRSGEEQVVVASDAPNVRWGLAEFVAQEEMGRMRGMWWSPDGESLLVQRTDTTEVESFHLADLAHPERRPSPRPYPRPGKHNAVVSLFLFSLSTGARVPVVWDQARWPYLAQVSWTERGPLTLVVQDRRQHETVLLTTNLETGETSVLHEERDEAWVNLDRSALRWLEGGEQFLWSTERSGHWQLELRDRQGNARALTTPQHGYRRVLAVQEDIGKLWFAGGADPVSTHVFEVSLFDGSDAIQLTETRGQHGLIRADAGGVAVRTLTNLEGARSWDVVDAAGTPRGALHVTAEEPVAWPSVTLTTVGERGYQAAIVRPRDFEPDRKYPVLVHVYGGPRHAMVKADGRAYLIDQWYADHGYIVVAFDGRGTPHRGRDWERAIHHDVITLPLQDQVDALAALGATMPQLDLGRVGIFGWSFGGYFSAHAVMQRPDVFHVGVAGAPVADWHDYDTHYTERYMGLPEDNVDGYHHTSVLTHAEALERPLLILHGTSDDNVWFSHALKMSDALFRAGRPHAFLPLSGFTHMVSDPLVLRRRHEAVLSFLGAALEE